VRPAAAGPKRANRLRETRSSILRASAQSAAASSSGLAEPERSSPAPGAESCPSQRLACHCKPPSSPGRPSTSRRLRSSCSHATAHSSRSGDSNTARRPSASRRATYPPCRYTLSTCAPSERPTGRKAAAPQARQQPHGRRPQQHQARAPSQRALHKAWVGVLEPAVAQVKGELVRGDRAEVGADERAGDDQQEQQPQQRQQHPAGLAPARWR